MQRFSFLILVCVFALANVEAGYAQTATTPITSSPTEETPPKAKRPSVTAFIDWTTNGLSITDRPKPGKTLRINISGLVYACHRPTINVIQNASSQSMELFSDNFKLPEQQGQTTTSTTTTTTGSTATKSTVTDGTPLAQKKIDQGDLTSFGTARTETPISFNDYLFSRFDVDSTNSTRRDYFYETLDYLLDINFRLKSRLRFLTHSFDTLSSQYSQALVSVTDFLNSNCGGPGKPNIQGAKNNWGKTAKPVVDTLLATNLGEITGAIEALQIAIQDGRDELDYLWGEDDDSPNREIVELLWRFESEIESHVSVIEQAQKNLEQLRGNMDQLKRSRDFLERSFENHTYTQQIVVNDDAAEVVVMITSSGRRDIESVEIPSFSDDFRIPVKRPHRVAITTGWLASTINNNRFDEVNRFTEPDSLGNIGTFRTYSNVGGGGLAHSPVIFAHITLADGLFGRERNGSVTLSSGITYRTVNNTPGAEFLGGLSIGVDDKFFLTLSTHFGRREKFLLGDINEVSTKQIPSEVTRDSIVGVKWLVGFAGALTLKINQ